MKYAHCLQKLTHRVRDLAEETGVQLRLVARGWMAHQVFIKLLQKSHTFVP